MQGSLSVLVWGIKVLTVLEQAEFRKRIGSGKERTKKMKPRKVVGTSKIINIIQKILTRAWRVRWTAWWIKVNPELQHLQGCLGPANRTGGASRDNAANVSLTGSANDQLRSFNTLQASRKF